MGGAPSGISKLCLACHDPKVAAISADTETVRLLGSFEVPADLARSSASLRLSTEGTLDRELGDAVTRTRLRAIRDEVREEAARRELAELKQQMLPRPSGVDAASHQREVPAVAS